jgi:hypothetical protein
MELVSYGDKKESHNLCFLRNVVLHIDLVLCCYDAISALFMSDLDIANNVLYTRDTF